METEFIIKLILSFLVGGGYIASIIWVSERFGSRIGGLLIGLPSTILISLLFIAWTQSDKAAVSALPIAPAAIGASALFLAIFIHQYRKWGIVLAYIRAILVWALITFPLIFFNIKNILFSLGLSALFISVSIYYLHRFTHQKLSKSKHTKKEFLFRSFIAGSVIAFAVFLGKVLGPLWGGVFASFPAAFSSSILLLERKHGIKFASSVARTMPYGSISNVVFVLVFYFIVPLLGISLGTMISYTSSIIIAYLLNQYVLKRR